MKKRIKFLEHFKDGNILPQSFRAGDIAVVEGWQADQITRSGGQIEVLERLIPLQKPAEEVTDEPPAPAEEVAPVPEPTPAPAKPAAKRPASRKKK